MESCPCCFEEFSSDYTVLGCSHRFHFSCLVSWFSSQRNQELTQSCPLCRHECKKTEALPDFCDDESQSIEEEDSLNNFLENSLEEVWQRVSEDRWMVITQTTIREWGQDHSGQPPLSLALQTHKAARRFQALWRGYRQRTLYKTAKTLLSQLAQ